MKRLEGKITVIAGAGCGFGMSRGFPEAFAKEGSHLVLNYYGDQDDEMMNFQTSLEKKGIRCLLVKGDISKEATARQLIDTAIQTFGRVDILINNAGISEPKLLQELNFDVWKRTIDINLNSVFLTCRAAIPYMIEQRYGRIINIASQVGQKGAVEHCHYGAAKAGMIGFTKSLAREMGGYGITVNCIAPGPIRTQLSKQTSQEWLEKKASELVIPRFGTIEEVIPSAIFLASEPDGNLYTGQTLGPNCGDVML